MFLVATVLICSSSLVLSSTVRINTAIQFVNTTTAQPSTGQNFTATQTCTDRIGNCVTYGSKICTGTFQEWAEINCKDYCGLCVDTVLVPTPGPLAPSPGTCADEIGNCQQYDKTICSGAYHVWAKQHCADFCGFCTQTSISTKPNVYTNAVSLPTSQTNVMCKDYSSLCAKYGSSGDICHEPYLAWAQTNCAAYCGFCSGNIQQVTKPVVDTHCANNLPNCQDYGKYACQGVYVEWAKNNCPAYCGLCGGPVASCSDSITNCKSYSTNVCGQYQDWAQKNCAKFCGLCGNGAGFNSNTLIG